MAEIVVAALLSATFFSKPAFRKRSFALSALIFVAVIPSLASAEKRILIEVSKSEKTSFKHLTAGSQSSGTEDVNSFDARIWGKMLDIGRENNVDGRMHLLPANCADDESSFARLPGGWVAVLNYTEKLSVSTGSGTVGECPGVVDRMKRALMFGASAIIILTLNPKIIRELDLSQMFSKPVALVDISENITNMLHLLSSKMKIKARFLYNIVKDIQGSQKFFTTVTLWGTCGRYSGRSYHEWDGVVCLGEDQNTNKDGKVDQENFWNYFYTGILFLMMIHYLRTRRGQNWEDPDYIDGSLRQLAYQALAVMKIKRYSPDGTNDTCAICLEKFFLKQKLRVLPCGHHFHTKCVDPWLVRSHTCPLCKLNIIEKLES
ncbi:RING finger protein 215-like isoform X2 [Mercenaria mercenaria]|uniref:RING finger protein 215-like isoform X2 n=1 Tax=Mercenaria mercenaria TaxID=6596 RepID=UPI00234FB375|nr:RING finger protein 215-like isoform X2 [Mercenaria mercenaria]